MRHRLGIIPHFSASAARAELHVTGCLTPGTSIALPPLVRRAFSVTGVESVIVDLGTARHIDPGELDLLRRFLQTADPARPGSGPDAVHLRAPAVLPACPTHERVEFRRSWTAGLEANFAGA